jgi:hypothetical protein
MTVVHVQMYSWLNEFGLKLLDGELVENEMAKCFKWHQAWMN